MMQLVDFRRHVCNCSVGVFHVRWSVYRSGAWQYPVVRRICRAVWGAWYPDTYLQEVLQAYPDTAIVLQLGNAVRVVHNKGYATIKRAMIVEE
jgi:hypothetical protein